MRRRDFVKAMGAGSLAIVAGNACAVKSGNIKGVSGAGLPFSLKELNVLAPEFVINNKAADILTPIDSGAVSLLTPINSQPIKHHLYVEVMLDEAIEHLNLCMDLKRQGQDLEASAINMILERTSTEKLSRLQKKEIEAEEAFSEYSEILSKQIEIDKKIGGKTKGTPASIKVVKGYESAIRELRKQKISIIDGQLNTLHKISQQKGSSLNLVERFNTIKLLFQNEFTEAYIRLRTVEEGLKSVYGIDMELPQIADSNYLSELYLWTKQVTNKLEFLLINDNEFTLEMSMVHGFYHHDKHNKLFPDAATFHTQRNAGTLKFKFKESMLDNLKNVRLRGVSARVEHSSVNYEGWNLRVKAPKQKLSSGKSIYLPKTHMTAYSMHPSTATHFNSDYYGDSLFNASPFGEWEIDLPKQGSRTNSRNTITHLYLVMKLAAIGEV